MEPEKSYQGIITLNQRGQVVEHKQSYHGIINLEMRGWYNMEKLSRNNKPWIKEVGRFVESKQSYKE